MKRLLLLLPAVAAIFCLTGFRNPPGAARSMELGEKALSEGNPDLALEQFGKAIATDPDKADFYLSRGFLLLKLGRFDAALEDLGSFIRLEPGSPQGHVTRGMIYDRLGKRKEADLDYSRACSLGDRSGCSFSSNGGQ
jgi:Flp pilus assembly protein TadD